MDGTSYSEILVGFTNQFYNIPGVYVARTGKNTFTAEHTFFGLGNCLHKFSTTNAVAHLPETKSGELSGSTGCRTAATGNAVLKGFVPFGNPFTQS